MEMFWLLTRGKGGMVGCKSGASPAVDGEIAGKVSNGCANGWSHRVKMVHGWKVTHNSCPLFPGLVVHTLPPPQWFSYNSSHSCTYSGIMSSKAGIR